MSEAASFGYHVDDLPDVYSVTLRGVVKEALHALAVARESRDPDMFGPLGHVPNLVVEAMAAGFVLLAQTEAPAVAARLRDADPALVQRLIDAVATFRDGARTMVMESDPPLPARDRPPAPKERKP